MGFPDQNNLCETESGFLRVPSLGFPDQSVRELGPDQEVEAKVQVLTNFSHGGVKAKKEEEDCCKTPTRLDQILPAIPQTCPPAPRKPKGVPSRSLKVRNTYRSRRMIILNVSREVDCMFQSISLCNKIKKARHI
ncbi:Cyclin-dependent protein kinase inhibitor SMR10 [Hirschfeldia incana]|nr:Cyclin-dependent protein kinase inhibitor SMR10 [Hirschfeldia incana]